MSSALLGLRILFSTTSSLLGSAPGESISSASKPQSRRGIARPSPYRPETPARATPSRSPLPTPTTSPSVWTRCATTLVLSYGTYKRHSPRSLSTPHPLPTSEEDHTQPSLVPTARPAQGQTPVHSNSMPLPRSSRLSHGSRTSPNSSWPGYPTVGCNSMTSEASLPHH